jgi:hypothetical protein
MRYLHVGWWNASLSPAGDARTHDAPRWDVFVKVLNLLLEDEQVDVLGLCEVSHSDVIAIKRLLRARGQFRVLAADPSEGVDLAILINIDKLDPSAGPLILRTGYFEQACVAGLQATVIARPTGTTLHLFVAHWPSRLFDNVGQKRAAMARAIRERLGGVLGVGPSPGPHALVMGDFNDEPFDESVTNALQSTRERAQARRKPSLLYNPFWRLLGERQRIEDERADLKLSAGTYYWRSGVETRWRTFDQILVSSSLLDPPGWVLREGAVRVLHPEALIDASTGKPLAKFDHLPVTSLFELVDIPT